MTVATTMAPKLAPAVAINPHLVPIRAYVQNYAWGLKPEDGSLAADLYAKNSGESIDRSKPYAEMWMGTHPSGPATIVGHPDRTLLEFLAENGLPNIPYLFKVLSVAKPLSIQAHPDKQLAKQLHHARPNVYKDDNHKPEMCVALTKFEGMCNFRPISNIHMHLRTYPALAELCGGEDMVKLFTLDKEAVGEKYGPAAKALLRTLFSTLMRSSDEAIEEALARTTKEIKAKEQSRDLSAAESLFLRLTYYYPGDVGCFAAFLLNFVNINPGQAFFMAANEPHAYLKGQCVEIMARSDNVVRAGLTPKFKDVETLINMLTYEEGSPKIWRGEVESDNKVVYEPPVEEFQLSRHEIPCGKSQVLPNEKGPGLVMCYQGSGRIGLSGDGGAVRGHELKPGCVFYMSNEKDIEVMADEEFGESVESLTFFRACVNQRFV